jgi:hypothetical protein
MEDMGDVWGKEGLNEVVVDLVNKPNHYLLLEGVEVIDVRDVLLDKIETSDILPMKHKQAGYYSEMMGYLMRCMDKNGLQDLEKAQFYLSRLISQLREGNS